MEPLSKFEQLQKIGTGGMGVVYKGWDPAIGRSVAIKFVRFTGEGHSPEREDFAARLRREGQAAGNLSHPNIVTIYDFVEEPDQAFIVMEFVDGQSLEAWLSDCELLGPHVVLDIIRQAATALDYAHSKGVIHRDVKPSNILIRNDGLVKLVDFGLAKVSTSARLTQTGAAIGTPYYMSAEQIDSDTVDARSDQYSLAVCTYEMMTGTRPFTGGSLHNLFDKILNTEPAPPPDLNPTLGKEIGAVLVRALSKKSTDRFASCMAFATALERACAITPSWRPKAPPATIKTSPERGGGGDGDVAVETFLSTPLDLNALAKNADPWMTEVILSRLVSPPPAPPSAPPPDPKPDPLPSDPPTAKRRVQVPAPPTRFSPPPPPPQPQPPPPPEPVTPVYAPAAVQAEPVRSGSGKLYAVIGVVLLLVAALVYVLVVKRGAKPDAGSTTQEPVVLPPAAIQPPPVEPEAKPVTKTKARTSKRPKAKGTDAAPGLAAKHEDPMDLISRPAAPIPNKKQ